MYVPHYSCTDELLSNGITGGDWAGSVYGQSGCPGTCQQRVESNPSSFSNAFFDFASVRVYQ